MILVTVGTQLGFDRLISAIDEFAHDLPYPVVAQVGGGSYVPKHMTAYSLIAPAQFDELASVSQIIVGHAGTGTILTAAKFEKPLVMLPRKAELGEHRNDHQVATANAFATRSGIFVAWNENEIGHAINQALEFKKISGAPIKSRSLLLRSVGQLLERWGV